MNENRIGLNIRQVRIFVDITYFCLPSGVVVSELSIFDTL